MVFAVFVRCYFVEATSDSDKMLNFAESRDKDLRKTNPLLNETIKELI